MLVETKKQNFHSLFLSHLSHDTDTKNRPEIVC